MDVTLGAIFHIAIAVFLPLIFVRMFVFLTEYVQSMGPSINDVTSFSWLYDPSLFNVTTYLHKFSTPFPLNIGDVIYGKPLCAEWVLFIDLVDTYTGASIIDIIFLRTLIPWPLYIYCDKLKVKKFKNYKSKDPKV